MSWIKRKVNDWILNQFGDQVILDQQEMIDIKKKNDYYEQRLGVKNILNNLSTPAPVTGEISSLVSPDPSVRLPRIPYYEYVYYVMRWNSSILRMIGFKLKQEIFRETRLRGFDWEGKFKLKCVDCGTEFEKQVDECEFCHSSELLPPDPTQKKLLNPYIMESNTAEQTLLEVLEELEDDLNTVDDAYMILIKNYVAGPGGVFGEIKEIMRGDPSRFRIVSDLSGRRGKKWWICIAHRNNPVEKTDYDSEPENRVCSQCGLPLVEVHYVETEVGGITPKKYYIKGEVIHTSKYEPSRLYGIPPMFSVYIIARAIQLMDLYTEELYEKGRLKGILGVATDNKVEFRKFMDETVSRLKNDPHYIPVVALDVGEDGKRSRMEFVKLIDSMDDLKHIEHRKMLKEEIAGLFGVNLIFLADTSVSGGLNNEGLQITVTDRTIEWGQSIHHDQFFPKLILSIGITDWKLKLKPSKETDEMAELERFDLRVDTATKLQSMGYTLKLLDDKFEVTGEAFVKTEPQESEDFDNSQSQIPARDGGNPKLLPTGQGEKPVKPKPKNELKRSIEIEKADEYTQLSIKIDNLYKIQVDKQKELIGLEQELRPLERKKKRWQGRHQRAQRGEAQDKILDDLRQLEHEINAMKQKIRNVKHELKQIDKNINQLIGRRSKLLKSDHINWDSLTKDKFFLINKSDNSGTNQDIIQVFDMERVNDESGQSGTGIVLSGIVFPDGKVVIRWNTETASTTEFDSWEDFEEIHIGKHPGNETKIYFYELNPKDTIDFAKSVVELGREVIDERDEIESHFAKELENIYLKQFEKRVRKLDDDSEQRLLMEIEFITRDIIPKVEKLAFREVIRSYKKGKQIDEERKETKKLKKTIDLPDQLTEPFKEDYGAFGLDQDDWQVLRAIYRRNPFWESFENMSQSISDKLKQHIIESYEAPSSARMKATLRDVQREYGEDVNAQRALFIAYGRIGKTSLAKVIEMMKRTINTEVYRLERIARTESTAIVSKGREIAFTARDKEGDFKYRWFGPNDKRTSKECDMIKSIVRKEGKGQGVSMDRLKEIQEVVVNRINPKWTYRDWVPHANCRHVIQRVV